MENAQHRHNISGGGWELLEPHLMYKNNQQSFTGGICRVRPYRRRPDIPRREWRPGRKTGRSEASVRHPVGVQSRGIFFWKQIFSTAFRILRSCIPFFERSVLR